MKFASLAMAAIAVTLTGCAATGPKFQEMEASVPKLSAEQGRVYFYRNASMLGGALTPAIKFDGSEVGESKQGGYFFVDAAAGNHEAATSTEATNKVTFVLDKGEVKYVRTSVSMGIMVGRVVPELVGADVAKKELAELSYTGVAKAK
ncbi:DUF2846 domain-containing protein [Pseudoduganella sp. LjRoot289]|uniref:DUF2846 domain-containing protein n=1 Tax=Pseudoduganella sp. LjRoot289 TaxID=3342314 RepID=UPI003ECE218A